MACRDVNNSLAHTYDDPLPQTVKHKLVASAEYTPETGGAARAVPLCVGRASLPKSNIRFDEHRTKEYAVVMDGTAIPYSAFGVRRSAFGK